METAARGCPQKVVFWKSSTVRSSTTSIVSGSDLVRTSWTQPYNPRRTQQKEKQTCKGRICPKRNRKGQKKTVGEGQDNHQDEEHRFNWNKQKEGCEDEKHTQETEGLGEIQWIREVEKRRDENGASCEGIGQLLSLDVVDNQSYQPSKAEGFGQKGDGRRAQKNGGPAEKTGRTNEIPFKVNQRVFHGAMTHPTASVRVVRKIGPKA